VLRNIPAYEKSANEIIIHFDTIGKNHQWQDTTFQSAELFSSQVISSENIIEQKGLELNSTKELTLNNLAQYVFLNSDTTVYYNTFNSESSMTKSYRHFLCFTPYHNSIRLDMINHGYKVIKTKNINQYWTYIIIEQSFD